MTAFQNDLLVIGADGFLGKKIQESSELKTFDEIFLVDTNFVNSEPTRVSDTFMHIAEIVSLEKIFYEKSQARLSENAFSGPRTLTILNLSGISRKGTFKNSLIESIKFVQNIEIATQLCGFISISIDRKFYSLTHFLHISTNGIVLDSGPMAYEKSKLTQELIFRGFFSNLGPEDAICDVIRLSDVYGSLDDHPDKVLNKLISNSRTGTKLEYVNQKTTLFPIHVDFVVDFLNKRISDAINPQLGFKRSGNKNVKATLFSLVPKRAFKIHEIENYVLSVRTRSRKTLMHKLYYKLVGRCRLLLSLQRLKYQDNALRHAQLKDYSHIEFVSESSDILNFLKSSLIHV